MRKMTNDDGRNMIDNAIKNVNKMFYFHFRLLLSYISQRHGMDSRIHLSIAGHYLQTTPILILMRHVTVQFSYDG